MSLLSSQFRLTLTAFLALSLPPVALADKEPAAKEAPAAKIFTAVYQIKKPGLRRTKVLANLKSRAQELKLEATIRRSSKPNKVLISLAAESEEAAKKSFNRLTSLPTLEIRKVHPESTKLAPQVAKKETVVAGWEYFLYAGKNDEGEEFTEHLLLKEKASISGVHIKNAFPDAAREGVINVELSNKGGDLMKALTKPMRKGVDRLAVVFDGQVMTAPTVNDTLTRNFIIMGMNDRKEQERVVLYLMAPLEGKPELTLQSLKAGPQP